MKIGKSPPGEISHPDKVVLSPTKKSEISRRIKTGDKIRLSRKARRLLTSPEKAKSASTYALLMEGARTSSKTLAGTAPLLKTLGTAGAVGLTVISARELIARKEKEKKLEAASGLAWGTQTTLLISQKAFNLGKIAGLAANTIGAVGAGLQIATEGKKFIRGIKSGDKKEKITSALGTSAGISWMLACLGVASPITTAGFVGFTIGKLAYRHKDKIAGKISSWIHKRE